LFAGTLPFDGTVMEILMAQIHQPIEPIAKRRGEAIDDSIEQLILRAMAKDPTQRHQSAAAFRYELNTVMDMLDMGRRRSRASGTIRAESMREATICQAFERSRLPQALISLDGTVVLANKAFAKLVGNEQVESISITETALAQLVPGLMRAIRAVHMDNKATERRALIDRANKPPLQLTLWLFPLPIAGQEVHMFARIEEATPTRKD
jgi:PAS domain-containing protein